MTTTRLWIVVAVAALGGNARGEIGSRSSDAGNFDFRKCLLKHTGLDDRPVAADGDCHLAFFFRSPNGLFPFLLARRIYLRGNVRSNNEDEQTNRNHKTPSKSGRANVPHKLSPLVNLHCVSASRVHGCHAERQRSISVQPHSQNEILRLRLRMTVMARRLKWNERDFELREA